MWSTARGWQQQASSAIALGAKHVKHDQFKKCVGQTLRLEPPAVGPRGQPLDDDWTVELDPTREAATLTSSTRGGSVIVGFDHIHSYTSDQPTGT